MYKTTIFHWIPFFCVMWPFAANQISIFLEACILHTPIVSCVYTDVDLVCLFWTYIWNIQWRWSLYVHILCGLLSSDSMFNTCWSPLCSCWWFRMPLGYELAVFVTQRVFLYFWTIYCMYKPSTLQLTLAPAIPCQKVCLIQS